MKRVNFQELLNYIPSEATIVTGMVAGQPGYFLSNLHKKGNAKKISVSLALPLEPYKFFMNPEYKNKFLLESWYHGSFARKSQYQGTVTFIPNQLNRAGLDRQEINPPDVIVLTSPPPDRNGFFNLSLSITYEKFLALNKKDGALVVMEVNPKLPRVMGDTFLHQSYVDYYYEVDTPLFTLGEQKPQEEEQKIGELISKLVEDGSTIQLGIGGIPNAVAYLLEDKNDLGVHTEMITESMQYLYKKGVINGKKKTFYPATMVGTFIYGSDELYRFVNENPVINLLPGHITNDPHYIGQQYKMVSINTALMVDLTGQVCSESIGIEQISGTGGQVNFHTGAQHSKNGKGILALRSTAKDGSISTIVPGLPQGSTVTLSRNDVDYIVTEFGVARLKGKSIKDRVEILISVAHPKFREYLREEAKRIKIYNW